MDVEEDIVEYCSTCLSLAIVQDKDDIVPYCNDCKGCNIVSGTFEEWESLHKEKYPDQWILQPRNIISRETIKHEYNILKEKLNGREKA